MARTPSALSGDRTSGSAHHIGRMGVVEGHLGEVVDSGPLDRWGFHKLERAAQGVEVADHMCHDRVLHGVALRCCSPRPQPGR